MLAVILVLVAGMVRLIGAMRTMCLAQLPA
jgi:hypothetical protein